MAIVDAESVVVGSANLDARSLRLNRELMVVTDDSGVCSAACKFVESLCAESTPAKRIPRVGLISRLLARVLSPLL